ncbi:hypothetical protein KR215_003449 [Drosophila sulfurigaster]|nr:hypothetical protein KR215_003449 [Drosophila sulfurigaster]
MRHNCNGFLLATLVTWTLVACNLVSGTTEGQETPLALPVAELTQPTTAIQGEVWEEDDHEVLIRNERGTKSDGKFCVCVTGQMTRSDKLKATSDPSCEATRVIKKNCKPGKSKDKSAKEQRKNKDKGRQRFLF